MTFIKLKKNTNLTNFDVKNTLKPQNWPLKNLNNSNLADYDLLKTVISRIWQIMTFKTLKNQIDTFWPLKNLDNQNLIDYDLYKTEKNTNLTILTLKSTLKNPKLTHFDLLKT